MLSLHQRQVDHLRQIADQRFELRLRTLLAEELARLGATLEPDSAELEASMHEGLSAAGQLEIDTDPEIAQIALLHVAAHHCPEAARLLSPWAFETLQRTTSSPLLRLAWIRHQLKGDSAFDDPPAAAGQPGAAGASAGWLAEGMERLRGAF